MRTSVVVLLNGLVLSLLVGVPASGQEPAAEDPEVGRLAGRSRVETAVVIAQASFPDGAGVVYLARQDVFADALAAGVLADGPVLLVPSCGSVPQEVVGEVARLDPDEVVALGGPAAVCDAMLTGVAAGRSTGRLAGVSRSATSVAIAQRAFPDGAEEVYIAAAADSPDAVAGGGLTSGPILLVPSSGAAPEVVVDEVSRLDPVRVVVLGGPAAVRDEVVESLAGGRQVVRVAGASRFETAAAIAAYEFGDGSEVGTPAAAVYLARGDVYADAVAAGSLADGPVLLVPSCGGVPETVRAQVDRLTPERVVALGGEAAVCQPLLEAVANPPVIPDTTVVLDEAAQQAMTGYDPAAGTITFGAGAPAVEIGDVIVSDEVAGVAPQGMLREVTGVSPAGGGLVVETVQAQLTDAIDRGAAALSTPLTAGDILTQQYASAELQAAADEGARQGASAPLVNITLADEVVLYDHDNDYGTDGDQVSVTGSFSLGATLNAALDIGLLSGLEEFSTTLDISQSAGLQLRAAPGFVWSGEREIGKIDLRPFTMFVGPVPIVLAPEVVISLTGQGQVFAEVLIGVTQTAAASAGFRWTDDAGMELIAERSFDVTADPPPTVTANADVKGALRARLDVEVYDVAGPYVYAEAYARAEGSADGQQFGYCVFGGIAAGVGFSFDDVPIVGDDLPRLDDTELLADENMLVEQPVGHCSGGFQWSGTVVHEVHTTTTSNSTDQYGQQRQSVTSTDWTGTLEIPPGTDAAHNPNDHRPFPTQWYDGVLDLDYRRTVTRYCDGQALYRYALVGVEDDRPATAFVDYDNSSGSSGAVDRVYHVYEGQAAAESEEYESDCLYPGSPPDTYHTALRLHVSTRSHLFPSEPEYLLSPPVRQEDGSWLLSGSLTYEFREEPTAGVVEEGTVTTAWELVSPTGP